MSESVDTWAGLLRVAFESHPAPPMSSAEFAEHIRDAMIRMGREGARPDPPEVVSSTRTAFMRAHDLHSLRELAEYLRDHPEEAPHA